MLFLSLLYAVYSSLVLFFIPFGVYYNTDYDLQTMAVTVAMAATFTATVEVRIALFIDASEPKKLVIQIKKITIERQS